MNCFLAYFDLLGYKKFIENNTIEHLDIRTNHFARNMEMAIAGDRRRESRHPGRIIPDLSESRINCLNFSDTVIFWTNGDTLEDFAEIFDVCFRYNHFNVVYDFPSRGCLVHGDIWFKNFDQENQRGGRYMLNMLYGKALIAAHEKAERMDWAGSVLAESAWNRAIQLGFSTELIDGSTLLYDVPYKDAPPIREYAFRLSKGMSMDETTRGNITGTIRSAFTHDRKGEISGRVKQIFDNTIDFLKAH